MTEIFKTGKKLRLIKAMEEKVGTYPTDILFELMTGYKPKENDWRLVNNDSLKFEQFCLQNMFPFFSNPYIELETAIHVPIKNGKANLYVDELLMLPFVKLREINDNLRTYPEFQEFAEFEKKRATEIGRRGGIYKYDATIFFIVRGLVNTEALNPAQWTIPTEKFLVNIPNVMHCPTMDQGYLDYRHALETSADELELTMTREMNAALTAEDQKVQTAMKERDKVVAAHEEFRAALAGIINERR